MVNSWPSFIGLICRLICCQFLVEFHVRTISIFGNIEFKFIVMCNLNSTLSCKSILKSCKSR